MNNEFDLNNNYIKLFNDCYGILFSMVDIKETKYNDDYFDLKPKKSLFSFKKVSEKDNSVKTIDKINLDLVMNKAKEKIKEFIDKDFKVTDLSDMIVSNDKGLLYKNSVRTFDQMWQFCQFVRYAEKVIFYKNDINNKLYVDSDMLDDNCRTFVINNENEDYSIYFKLEYKTSPNKELFETISISVERNYGKKHNNKYFIVNADIKYKDISDVFLINTINSILYESTYKTFNDIMNQLLKFMGDRTRWEQQIN